MAQTLYFNIRLTIEDKTMLDTMATSMKLPAEEVLHRLIANNFKAAKLEWPPEPKTTKHTKKKGESNRP